MRPDSHTAGQQCVVRLARVDRKTRSTPLKLYSLLMSGLLDALDVDLLRTMHENPRIGTLELARPAGGRWTVTAVES